jgi:hypothetical protein
MLKMKQEGRWLSNAPIGYRLENGRLQIGSESEVAIIQRIFSLRSGGHGCFSIAKTLNASKIPTARGACWHPATIRHLLKNPVYIGQTRLGKYARGKYARVLDGIVTIEDTHPAIVDSPTWQTVQSMWSSEGKSPFRRGTSPLSGLLFCGRCGESMYAGPHDSYLCSTYHAANGCGCCKVNRSALLGAVATKIREHVLLGSPARLEAAIQRQLDRRQQPAPKADDTAKRIATLDRQIARAADRILAVDDSLVPELEQRLLAMKGERDQLETVSNTAPAPKRPQSAKAIASKIWELDRILRGAPAATVRHALTQLVDHIRLDFEPKIGASRTRRSYRFVGGTIQFTSQKEKPGTALPRSPVN